MKKQEDNTIKVILVLLLIAVLLISIFIGVLIDKIATVLLGVLIPIIIFIAVYLLVSGMKKKIFTALKKNYGDNVVNIAAAIINYFEVPLTIILSVSLTLFILSISMVILFVPKIGM